MELLARFGQYGARSTLLKREKDESVVQIRLIPLFGARRVRGGARVLVLRVD